MFKWRFFFCAVALAAALVVPAHGSVIATLEQGRIDVHAILTPIAGPPISSVTQIGALAGGTATNTYGIGPTGAPLIRTVGAIPIVGLQVPGPDHSGIQGPGAEPHSLFFVFGIDGFVQTFDPVTQIFTALFTEARLGVFRQQATGFDRDDPTTWVPFEGDFLSPVITWVLTDPKPVFPGQGEQLDPFDADEVNTSGASAAAGGRATGEFLFVEEFDPGPGHPVPTPPNQGFLDVTTGHEGFIGDPEEGLFLTTAQTTTIKFTGTTGNPQLTAAQQAVLQDISQWALGVNFATSFYNAADSLTGFNPIVTAGGSIQVFNPATGMGGDFFSNQDSVEAHPTLQGAIIPEPGTLAIWGLGLIGVAFVARRRKARK